MKNKTIEDREVRRFIWEEYRLDGYTLFYEADAKLRDEVLRTTIEKFTNYRLVEGRGLVENHGKGPDEFSGFRDTKHCRSIDALCFDINQAIKASKDRNGRRRRADYLLKKQQFEQHKQKVIESYNRGMQALRFDPPDAATRKRYEDLKRHKKEQQDKDFER